MREILFRGKRKDNGEWEYGDLWCNPYGKRAVCIVSPINDQGTTGGNEVIPETVGQYTNMKDKKGNMIFEGDIIGTDRFGIGHQIDGYVVYNENKGRYELVFELDGNAKMYVTLERDVTVEGNIHDNPEIMN